ncbi:hypothetical protein MNBD_GAMMA10-1361 [hydrothermal vent metagenome]|uniref:Uncharacterized protein n=1 Tax=hydrothermal vent metagenome TaxID=652676 RepID=A0A3B0Y927_9ZZZZ
MKNNKLCKHLKKDFELDYIIRFTGQNNSFEMMCEKCATRLQSNFQPDLYPLDQQLLSQVEEYNWLECETPSIGEMRFPSEHPELKFISEKLPSEFLQGQKICALQPHPLEAPQWFVLNGAGEVLLVDIETQQVDRVYQLLSDWIDISQPVHLSVSADARFIAVVNSYHVYGEVIDLQASAQTMKLERSDYHVEHCFYPLAFVEYGNKTRLIHATDWNHLDIVDPATGNTLVEHPEAFDRDLCEAFDRGASFRGELLVSPDQNWIVDNAWEWHPVGVVSSWNIKNWIEQNPWEFLSSESLLNHTGKEYVWGQPVCWINNTTVCITGWSRDDCQNLPAVSFFDVRTGERSNWFYGPDGRLVFDEYLFSFIKDKGIAVWDINEGVCLLKDTSVNVRHYHPVGRYFIDFTQEGEWSVRRLSHFSEHEAG